MKTSTRVLGTVLLSFGMDPRRIWASIRFLPLFIRQTAVILTRGRADKATFPVRWVPILSDKHMPSGTAKGHYFHQDLWAARRIFASDPTRHIDVGSRIDGFVAHLLVFRAVTVLDVRHLQSKVEGLTFKQADLTQSSIAQEVVDSVSCLHALEHFGLGRYGDELDLDGWRKGLKVLSSMTSIGGTLYLSVPIGTEQCIEFNAQRIFLPNTMIEAARQEGMELSEFSFVDDQGDFFEKVDPLSVNCVFGCGCYAFRKTA